MPKCVTRLRQLVNWNPNKFGAQCCYYIQLYLLFLDRNGQRMLVNNPQLYTRVMRNTNLVEILKKLKKFGHVTHVFSKTFFLNDLFCLNLITFLVLNILVSLILFP